MNGQDSEFQEQVKIIECPRDAMQGWSSFIETDKKIEYLNALLKVGFHSIDFGSFVSPKAIPQMADVREVLNGLDLSATRSKLLAIVANKRGAEDALSYKQIAYLGFPFSISETFQRRNTNSGIGESYKVVAEMQELASAANRQLVVYLSMAFGNPYGDEYNEEIVAAWAERIYSLGIPIISLADTVGLANASQIARVTKHVIDMLPNAEIGVHLHSTPQSRDEKIVAALEAGCIRFDSAVNGIGGCPMAGNTLVGNLDTIEMTETLQANGVPLSLDFHALQACASMATTVFV